MPKLLFKVIRKHFLILNSVNLFFKNKIKYIGNIKKKRRDLKISCPTLFYNNNRINVILLVNWFLFIFLLCDHFKLAQSRKLLCTPCEIKSEIGKKNSNINNDGLPAKASYEEYVFEHQVTRQQAIAALRMLNDSFFNGPTDPGCKAFDCEKHMKYCLGTYFLNDHCFCEQSHTNEGLPFVPHSCYVGEDNQAGTKPSIGSCFRFAEIKECCCLRPLAQRWKYLSTARIISNNLFLIIVLPIFLLLLN